MSVLSCVGEASLIICRVTGEMRGHDEFELLRNPLVPAGTDEFLTAKPSNPYEATGGWR
jgi:hypothetical protein